MEIGCGRSFSEPTDVTPTQFLTLFSFEAWHAHLGLRLMDRVRHFGGIEEGGTECVESHEVARIRAAARRSDLTLSPSKTMAPYSSRVMSPYRFQPRQDSTPLIAHIGRTLNHVTLAPVPNQLRYLVLAIQRGRKIPPPAAAE